MLIPNQGADLRKGRFSESGQIYLLTSVTHSRRPLFDNWHYGRLMVAEFQKHNMTVMSLRSRGL